MCNTPSSTIDRSSEPSAQTGRSVRISRINLFRLDAGYSGLDQEGFYTLSDQVRIKYDQLRYPLARRFTVSFDFFY